MATTSRDVTLTLAVETLGADGVKQLQTAFANLAKEGGNAGPEFKQLADQIARLGEQNDALNAFKQLTVATDELKASQAAAGFALDATATELIALNAAASQAGEQQRQAAQAVIEGKKAYIDLAAAIRDLKRDTDAAGKESDAYQQRLKSLGVAQDELKKKQIDLNAALRESNTEVRNAERDVAKLETKYNQQATALDRTADALLAQAGELKNASTEAAKLGVATDDIVAAETQLVGVMARGTAALQSSADATRVLAVLQQSVTKTKIEQAAATERLAAREREFSADRQRQAEQEQQAFAETARAAKLAADQIQNAFQTVGVRSAEQLQAEIAQVRAAMQTLESSSLNTGKALNGAFASGEAKIKALERELRELNGTLTTGDKAAKLFSNSMGQITAGNLIADGVGYLVNKVKELGVAFVTVIVQSDQLRRGLNAVYKDTETTARQMAFLRQSSQESGVAFSGLSQEFVKFSASMKSANIPLEQSNALFKAVTAASASLGLGAEATAGTLNALGQIASKGTVSLEELRAQLGDRLPGALGLTAKGLGITEAQLIKLVESGGLAARDFFGPFTKSLNELKGETDGIVPTFERLKGALQGVAVGAGDAGGVTVLTRALQALVVVSGLVLAPLSALLELFLGFGKAIGILAGALVTLTNPLKELGLLVSDAAKRQSDLTESFNQAAGGADTAGKATADLAKTMTTATAETVKSINANTSLSASQKLAALSTALAADTTLDASAKMVQYNVAAAELIKGQQVQIESYSKLAKAAKEQGDTMIAIAKLSGDEAAIRQASAAAATLHADALQKVADAQQIELELLTGQRAELEASAKARNLTQEAIKAEVEALDNKIKKSEAETEQSKQAALAAQQEVAARKLLIETYGDQSAKVAEYAKALEALRATLVEYEKLAAEGKATEAEVAAIRERVAVATVKYKDALTDLNEKTKQESEFKAASLRITAEALGGEVQLLEAKAKSARASGDLVRATELETQAKEKKIEIDKIGIQIKETELKLERAEIELKLEKLKLEEPENTLKRQKLELELKLNDMKTKGLESGKQLIELAERELRNQRLINTGYGEENANRLANASAMGTQMSALEQLNATREREIAIKEKAAELDRRERNVDKEGFSTNKDGQRINAGSDLGTATGVRRFLMEAGVTDQAQATALTREFLDSQGNVQYSNNPGQIKYGGSTLSEALLKAAERITFGGGGGGGGGFNGSGNGGGGAGFGPNSGGGGLGANAGSGGGGGFTPAQSPPNSGAGSNVTINLGAGVNMSNRADVEKLARTLIPAIEGLNRRGVSAG